MYGIPTFIATLGRNPTVRNPITRKHGKPRGPHCGFAYDDEFFEPEQSAEEIAARRAAAQAKYRREHYQVEDALADSLVAMLQRKERGNLWQKTLAQYRPTKEIDESLLVKVAASCKPEWLPEVLRRIPLEAHVTNHTLLWLRGLESASNKLAEQAGKLARAALKRDPAMNLGHPDKSWIRLPDGKFAPVAFAIFREFVLAELANKESLGDFTQWIIANLDELIADAGSIGDFIKTLEIPLVKLRAIDDRLAPAAPAALAATLAPAPAPAPAATSWWCWA